MTAKHNGMIGLASRGIAKIPFLDVLLDAPVRWLPWPGRTSSLTHVAGWGARPSGRRAEALAARLGLPVLHLEDGFLRSWGTGEHFPGLSLVVDRQGIYYDSTRPSDLEVLLNSPVDVLEGIAADVVRARALILEHRLSKYNHAPLLDSTVFPLPDPRPRTGEGNVAEPRPGGIKRVLVVDQTAGDMSVSLGGADAATFAAMLAAARDENPDATIYVKTHPEVSSGRKRGYLTTVQEGARTVVLRQAINPLSLIEQMDRVYVVSSTMGFEALLTGKPVTCFGLPWYAGWGATDDRQPCPRRSRGRNVDELFAAAYFHYTRYLDPVTGRRGTLFDVIDWLIRQRETAARYPGRMVAVGMQRWKAAHVKPLLSLTPGRVHFVCNARAAAALNLNGQDRLVVWGRDVPADVQTLARQSGTDVLRMEDGFVRSVGLGSDLIRPWSVILDAAGLYIDPTQPSALEHILATAQFSDEERRRARRVREFITAHGVTKYNLEPRDPARWPSGEREVVLVCGQVEDDASIRYGCTGVKTNLALLEAARRTHPEAFVVYKPHPDVASGNRAGKVTPAQAATFADHVETELSVVSCLDACDVLHTMTSLTGFDALLRGKRVVVYGQPFYAGWGLTEDVVGEGVALARRRRRLTLDELVSGTLLRYPLYWDWQLRGYTCCEAVLQRLVARRDALAAGGALDRLRRGFLRRQGRKLVALARAWLEPV